MRMAMMAAGAMALAACSGGGSEVPEANEEVLANYVPPFVMSRLDFGGVVERRFRRLDVNADDKLTRNELPKRLQGRFEEIDRDRNGSISNDEWSAWMLARFDAQDANHDGNVTSDERERARELQETDLPTPADEPAGNAK
ncbi:hypothetical protein [Sphingomonas adhaesiva]|uniref:hypothetical protein n=1 Tax=Sphingomonas adhaesiva TaxID=28212 RepID=UPI002FF61EBE